MFVTRNRSAKSWAMRPPTGRVGWGVPHRFVIAAPATTYVLENASARFTFKRDTVAGFRLVSMERLESGLPVSTWAQADTDLWSATVFDCTQANPLQTSVVMPSPNNLSVESSTASAITILWAGNTIDGVDSFDVTMTLELRAGEDWLRCAIAFAWIGTPARYAIDSFRVLPLRIAPRDRGSDFAVLPNVTGILAQDPVETLRYNPGSGRPSATFGNFIWNAWTYPTGRGAPIGMWGYYSRAAREGWMVWTERWDRTPFSVLFQSDGANLLWQASVPCEDSIVVGNGGRALGITDFCLRPMQVGYHGWASFGEHYRRRQQLVAPSILIPKRIDRIDLSSFERGPWLFLDAVMAAYHGSSAPVAALQMNARNAVRPGDPPPSFSVFEVLQQNIYLPFELEIGDLRSTLDLMFQQNSFGGVWQPGIIGPNPWDIHRWAGDELRWWTTNLVVDSFRQSRRGALEGGGSDRLVEQGGGAYYHERIYPVTGWNALTRTLSITGNPGADSGFVSTMVATLIPISGAARLATTRVQSLGNGQLVTTGNFADATGAAVIPQAGDQVAVWSAGSEFQQFEVPFALDAYCPDAMAHSSTLLARFVENATAAPFEKGHNCHSYLDVQTTPSIKQTFVAQEFCFRDHSGWAGIAPGYQRHPLGGGRWYVEANHTLVKAHRDAARQRQFDLTGKVAFLLSGEDVDETMHDAIDFCWHGNGAGDLFRVMHGVDPTIHGCKAVPLYSVVHAGRVFGRALNHELSTVALASVSPVGLGPPKTDAVLHATMAYELAEWVYGFTMPALSTWFDDVNGSGLDFFDDAQYIENGGTVSNTVRQLRDQWVAVNRGLITFRDYIPYGRFLPPAHVDVETSDTTTGYADSFYTGQYVSYDVLYDRAAFPKVLNSVWQSRVDSTLLIVLHNWTGDTARFAGDFSDAIAAAGFEDQIALEVVDALGAVSDVGATLEPDTGIVVVDAVPPFGVVFVRVAAAVVTPELEVPQTREGIRGAVVEILKGATDAGDRVFPNRVDPWEEEIDLPAIGVYTPAEESRLNLEAPFEYEREVSLVIEAIVGQEGRKNGDDAIEVMVRQVRAALMLDEGARGTAARSWYTGQTTTVRAEGARVVFASRVRFTYRYYSRIDEIPPDASTLSQVVGVIPIVGEGEGVPPIQSEDWGSTAVVADESEDWGSTVDPPDESEDWGSTEP
jgi:hypothetical protein